MAEHRHGATDEDGNCVMGGLPPEFCAGCREIQRRGFVDEGAPRAPRQRAVTAWGERGGVTPEAVGTAIAWALWLGLVAAAVRWAYLDPPANGKDVVAALLVFATAAVALLSFAGLDWVATDGEAGHGDDA
jgi:hypothetical protein